MFANFLTIFERIFELTFEPNDDLNLNTSLYNLNPLFRGKLAPHDHS